MQEIIFINEKMLKYSLRLVSVSAKSIFMSKNYKILALEAYMWKKILIENS